MRSGAVMAALVGGRQRPRGGLEPGRGREQGGTQMGIGVPGQGKQVEAQGGGMAPQVIRRVHNRSISAWEAT